MIEVSAPWRDKVHKVINALCRQSYLKANMLPNGQLRKRHVPYTVPQEAQDLIKCLNSNDEVAAKSLIMHDYAISKV